DERNYECREDIGIEQNKHGIERKVLKPHARKLQEERKIKHQTGQEYAKEKVSRNRALLTTEQRINLSTTGCRLENTTDLMQIEDPSDHIYLHSIRELTNFSKNVVVYVAGFVIKRLYKTIKCEQCLGILVDSSNKLNYHLIAIKHRGGLLFPSSDVTDILHE
ncbi:hypothetical protein ILUMI_22937, partial [Ignelater luminosus]